MRRYVFLIFSGLVLSGVTLLFQGCDPQDPMDPDMPMDSMILTRADSIIGTYNGQCINVNVSLNMQTGQQVITRDTQPGEIKVTRIDTTQLDDYILYFSGTYFQTYVFGHDNFQTDTIYSSFYFGSHSENVKLLPRTGVIITHAQHNNPFGFGGDTRDCICQKQF